MKDILEKLVEVSGTQREILANQGNQQKILEKHSNILEEQEKVLLRNTITVEEHHKRSTYLEARQENLENEVKKVKAKVQKGETIKGFLKNSLVVVSYIIGILGSIGTALWSIHTFLKSLGV